MKSKLRLLLMLALLLAVLAAGSWVAGHIPSPTAVADRPFYRRGVVGETVEFRIGKVTVNNISVAKTLKTNSEVVISDGVLLLIDFQFAPSEYRQPIPSWYLEDAGGRLYGGIMPATRSCGSGQPGTIVHCQTYLELPPSALVGAHLAMQPSRQVGHKFTARQQNAFSGPDDIVLIDLQLSKGRADELVAAAGDAQLSPPTVEVAS